MQPKGHSPTVFAAPRELHALGQRGVDTVRPARTEPALGGAVMTGGGTAKGWKLDPRLRLFPWALGGPGRSRAGESV